MGFDFQKLIKIEAPLMGFVIVWSSHWADYVHKLFPGEERRDLLLFLVCCSILGRATDQALVAHILGNVRWFYFAASTWYTLISPIIFGMGEIEIPSFASTWYTLVPMMCSKSLHLFLVWNRHRDPIIFMFCHLCFSQGQVLCGQWVLEVQLTPQGCTKCPGWNFQVDTKSKITSILKLVLSGCSTLKGWTRAPPNS